jgi:hypothetical protein
MTRRRRRLSSFVLRSTACVTALLIAAGLGTACSRAPATPGLAGCYGAELTARDGRSSVKNAGVWKICFDADGRYHAENRPGQEVDGRWSMHADEVLLVDTGGSFSCRSKGVDTSSARYRVHRSASALQLELLRDECNARRDALNLRSFDALP